MRILHIVNNAETGGAQTLIEALGATARVGGDGSHEHFLLVLLGRGALSERLENIMTGVQYAELKRQSVIPLRAIRLLRKMVTELGIDIVHSHLLQSDLVNILTCHGRPRVSTVHTSGGHESRAVSQIVGRAVAALSGAFTAVVACSRSAQDYTVAMKYRRPAEAKVIFNGTVVPSTAPQRSLQKLRLAGPTVLHLARWHPMKDHNTLFAAMAEVLADYPDAKLECAGLEVSEHNADLRELRDAAGISERVALLGSVSDVGDLFRSASALVISSSHGEALPMAGIEALAAGVPVITTDVGDCRDLAVDPQFLVSPEDPSEIAEALRVVLHGLLNEPGRYSGWCEDAWRLSAQKFDVLKTSREYHELYSAVLN